MPDADSSLTAGTLIDGARMYAAAADAVNDKLPNSLHVLSHLLATSIELALKAHLRQSGYSIAQLVTLGHNLGKLFDDAVAAGLLRTGSRSYVLRVVGYNYAKRLFVYPHVGTMTVIMPWRLRQITNELIRETFVTVKGQAEYDTFKGEPGLCVQSRYPEELEASAWAVALQDIDVPEAAPQKAGDKGI
jgi:hypothetical protein